MLFLKTELFVFVFVFNYLRAYVNLRFKHAVLGTYISYQNWFPGCRVNTCVSDKSVVTKYYSLSQIKSNQKVLFKVGTFYNNQHKLSRAFQTDMHNKLHKLNTAQ